MRSRMRKRTWKTLLKHVEAVVDESPRRFNPGVRSYNDGCYHFDPEDYSPSCVVGHALDRYLPNYIDRDTVPQALGMPDIQEWRDLGFNEKVTDPHYSREYYVISKTQDFADEGKSWAVALRMAKEWVAEHEAEVS